jgi:hypothetical protein
MLYYNKYKYNKYHNKKTRTSDGIEHDSQKEARRWMELQLLQKAGEIKDLERQVRFELIPKQDGERPCYYIADFVYTDLKTGEKVVEDVKSEATRKDKAYIIKRKLMQFRHGIKIREY